MNIYEEHGFTSRKHYLQSIAEDYGFDENLVFFMANILGPEEDFDGLINAIEDELYEPSFD